MDQLFQIPATPIPIVNQIWEGDDVVSNISGYIHPYLAVYLNLQQQQKHAIVFGHLLKQDWKKLKLEHKLERLLKVVKAIQFLDTKGYVLALGNIDDMCYQTDSNIQLLYHSFTKNSELQKNKGYKFEDGAELVLEDVNQSYYQYLNTWKIGKLLLKVIWEWNQQQYFSQYKPTKDQKTNLYKQLEINIKKIKFQKEEQLLEMTKNCLKIQPKSRTAISTLIGMMQTALMMNKEYIESESIIIARDKYQQQCNNIKSLFHLEIKQKVLLTEELKKKIGNYIKVQIGKNVSKFKQIYRGSYFQFSCRKFYQLCSNYSNVLVIISVKGEKNNKICAYSVESFNLAKLNGIFGALIADPTNKSFIFSTLNDQFYKLRDNSKAIGISITHGPIIGDGDIVIGDMKMCNYSRFPCSYNSGRRKKLVKEELFDIDEYDVYKVQLA